VNALDLIFRDDYGQCTQAVNEMIRTGNSVDLIARSYVKNGPVKIIHVNGHLLYDKDRNISGLQGSMRDITKESKMKELLKKQEEQLSLVFNNAPFGIVLFEGDSIIKSNGAFLDMIGYSFLESINLDLSDIFEPENYISTDSGKNESVIEFSKNILTRNGEVIKTRINIKDFVSESNNGKYKIAIVEDITAEFAKQEEYLEQNKQLEIILEKSPLGIILAENDTFRNVNPAFCDLLGYSKREIFKTPFNRMIYHDDLENNNHLYQKLLQGEIDQFMVVQRYVKKNGDIIHAKTNVSAVRNSDGDLHYIVGVLEDITDQIESEITRSKLLKQLEKSNVELHNYAHIVSHDLKSPVRNISTLVSWIKSDCDMEEDHPAHKQIQLIENNLEKMEALIQGILIYSSVGTIDEPIKDVPLENVINSILKILFIPEHVKVRIISPLPIIRAHELRLQQLFQNIISNAINYIDKETGEVEVDCKEEDVFWVISVRDNGIGIPKRFHEKIFEIFQSLGTDVNVNSTGIGLSIVKKIVDQYEGEIDLISEEGKGTTFFVKFKKELHYGGEKN